jgi:hypothetical protein
MVGSLLSIRAPHARHDGGLAVAPARFTAALARNALGSLSVMSLLRLGSIDTRNDER